MTYASCFSCAFLPTVLSHGSLNFQTVWFQWWEITDGWENWLRHEWSWFSSPDYPGLILMPILCIIVNLIVFSVRRSILSSDYYIIYLQYTACWLFIFIPAAVSLRNILKAGMLAFIRIKMMYFVSSKENFYTFVAMFMFAKSVFRIFQCVLQLFKHVFLRT